MAGVVGVFAALMLATLVRDVHRRDDLREKLLRQISLILCESFFAVSNNVRRTQRGTLV
ncbi:hypothetical protein [Paraburkholderia sp. C35]|uniref:hypothetical protein n=1 Tax=Paraburkholderia sp. C35 TaxID=2126993 RepID=UPI0013A559C4|nr:hypothetical protein [Paraburkholderia sp. C35]